MSNHHRPPSGASSKNGLPPQELLDDLCRTSPPSLTHDDDYALEPIDQQEVFDHLRDIKDPEHPYSLEELKVITEEAVEVDDHRSYVRVTFTPTVEHCSMATIIGLCLRVKLMRSLPSRYKCLIVKGWKGSSWSFPRGKKSKDEEDLACAIKEVMEETGFDVSKLLNKDEYLEVIFGQQRVRLYIIAGVKNDTAFAPLTKKEISEIAWHQLDELQPPSDDVISRGITGLIDIAVLGGYCKGFLSSLRCLDSIVLLKPSTLFPQ